MQNNQTTMVKTELGPLANTYLERIQDKYDCNKSRALALAVEAAYANKLKLEPDDEIHRLADAQPNPERLAGAKPHTQPTNNDNDE